MIKSEEIQVIKNEILSGFFFSIFLSVSFFMFFSFLFDFLYKLNKWLYLLLSSFLIYTSISLKSMKDEIMPIYNSLKNKEIENARRYLSNVVRRDTEKLDESEIIRAAIETISENTVDGIISPIFYAFIGGVPLDVLYKVVNTLDSMVGYKNEKYRYFGIASARFDDILNFIPARLSIIFISLAFFFYNRNGLKAFKISLRDGHKNPSPNSGYPESCFAGGLGIRLGGINYYNSVPIFKPYLGDKIKEIDLNMIVDALNITYITSFLFVITLVIGGIIWRL